MKILSSILNLETNHFESQVNLHFEPSFGINFCGNILSEMLPVPSTSFLALSTDTTLNVKHSGRIT